MYQVSIMSCNGIHAQGLVFKLCKVQTLRSSLPHECARKVMFGSPGLVQFIGMWAHVRLTCCKQDRVVRKQVDTNPRLKINQIMNCFCIQIFFTAFLCILRLKTEGQIIYRKPYFKVANSNQHFRLSWVSLIRLWTTQCRRSAFRLG